MVLIDAVVASTVLGNETSSTNERCQGTVRPAQYTRPTEVSECVCRMFCDGYAEIARGGAKRMKKLAKCHDLLK